MHAFLGRLIISFVLFLILFPVLSSQVYIIWPWYGRVWSVELICLLLPFNLIAAMLLQSYYLCIMTDPGKVPGGWEPDISTGDGLEVKKLTGSPRFCRTCNKYKPPRAHHCRQCHRCVLRMVVDHHCPWVNNCIGHFNFGHFLRFLFYVDICCSYHLAMVTRRVFWSMGRRYFDEPTVTDLIFIVMNYVTVLPVILCVGAMSLYHVYGFLTNTTTIERLEKDRAATLKRHGKIHEVKYPYDLGAWRNVTSMLGNNPLLWCCPLAPQGTGLKFQLSGEVGESSNFPLSRNFQHSWPSWDPASAEKQFKLPSNPWTYDNGNVNPNLQPSNSSTPASRGYTSALPPYHPDFDGDSSSRARQSYSSDSSDRDDDYQGVKVRRGSEGYEVHSLDREEMLKRYLESELTREGRYQLYGPDPSSEYDNDSISDEDTPLGLRN
ncbi:zf-DHHC-domain-containing protein [Scleroderma citrinum]